MVDRGVLVVTGTGDDQHAAVDAQHVDVVAVELLKARRSGRPRRSVPLAARPAARYTIRSITGSSGFISWAEISTAICCSRGDPRQQSDDLLGAAQVEVRQRLVEQQQRRAADQRVRDQDPLLLAA